MKAPNGDEDFKDAPMPMPPWMRARRSGARVEPHFANSPSAAAKAADGKIHWPPPPAKLARSDTRVGMGEVRLLRFGETGLGDEELVGLAMGARPQQVVPALELDLRPGAAGLGQRKSPGE